MTPTHHTVTALVQNESGTINRVVSLFRRRGFSLASFNAGDCEQPGFSRMTFVVDGDRDTVGQVLKQLDKLVDVVECTDLAPDTSLGRELALIRCRPDADRREAFYKLVLESYAKTPASSGDAAIVEFAGAPKEVEALIAALAPYGIEEIVRTGLVAIEL